MKTNIHQSIQRLFSVNTYIDRGLTLVKGQGVYLYDHEGIRYLDLSSNYGVNIFGYNHPVISLALKEQIDKLMTLHGSFNNDTRALASKILVKRCGNGLKQVYFSNSGSEAIEAALKFAVLATNKKRFIVAKNGYHGKTLGSLSATQSLKYKKVFAPLLWEFKAVDFGKVTALETAVNHDTAAVILEPIQGEGGINIPNEGYLKKIKKICDKNGSLLILDEIQTGCGRTGSFLASEREKINYDILCLGKGLAGGIPIGATLINQTVADCIPKHIHTSTFGGNPLACAGVTATLNLLDDQLLDHVAEMGLYFKKELSNIKEENIKSIRGRGLMIGIQVKENRDSILKDLQNNHILAIPAGEDIIRLLPPLIINKKQINQAVKIFSQII